MALDSDAITEVYGTASSLLPAAESFARQVGFDPALAEDTLMEAADRVIDVRRKGTSEIINLPGYLFSTYKRLILLSVRRSHTEKELSNEQLEQISDPSQVAAEVERKILIEEVVRHMDPQSRFIFDCLLLGYSYRDISKKFSQRFGLDIKDNALRSKFSKTVQRLAKQLAIS